MVQPASLLRLIGSERSDIGRGAPRMPPAPSRFSLSAFAPAFPGVMCRECGVRPDCLSPPAPRSPQWPSHRRVRPVRRPSKSSARPASTPSPWSLPPMTPSVRVASCFAKSCRMVTACCSISSESNRAFWMRNTYVSLDMIFITGYGRILRIAQNTRPFSGRLIPLRWPDPRRAGSGRRHGAQGWHRARRSRDRLDIPQRPMIGPGLTVLSIDTACSRLAGRSPIELQQLSVSFDVRPV